MTPAGGGGWVGRGNSEIEQRGPSSKHTACFFISCTFPLAINFAYSFEQLFKGDCKPVYLGPSGTLFGETKDRAFQNRISTY